MYLNRVYFGAGAYGIDAAARRYFDREARALTLPQAAILAGAASRAEPLRAEPQPRRRASSAPRSCWPRCASRATFPRRRLTEARDHPARAASYHMSRSENYVADWVMDVLPFHVGAIERTWWWRRRSISACRSRPSRRSSRRSPRRARNTASARAPWWSSTAPARCAPWWAAAPMRRASSTARSTRRRQPGSAFKPFVYLTAIEQLGYRPDTVRVDEPVTFGKWSPKNSDNNYRGPVTLKEALALFHQHGGGAARRRGRRRRRWCRRRSAWASTRRSPPIRRSRSAPRR